MFFDLSFFIKIWDVASWTPNQPARRVLVYDYINIMHANLLLSAFNSLFTSYNTLLIVR